MGQFLVQFIPLSGSILDAIQHIRKESRAVGFKGKEAGFDWLAHVVLDVDFSVISACLASYQEIWPEIQRTVDKVGYSTSSRLPSSVDITSKVKGAQNELGFGI